MKAILPSHIYFDLIVDFYKYINIFNFIMNSRSDSINIYFKSLKSCLLQTRWKTHQLLKSVTIYISFNTNFSNSSIFRISGKLFNSHIINNTNHHLPTSKPLIEPLLTLSTGILNHHPQNSSHVPPSAVKKPIHRATDANWITSIGTSATTSSISPSRRWPSLIHTIPEIYGGTMAVRAFVKKRTTAGACQHRSIIGRRRLNNSTGPRPIMGNAPRYDFIDVLCVVCGEWKAGDGHIRVGSF